MISLNMNAKYLVFRKQNDIVKTIKINRKNFEIALYSRIVRYSTKDKKRDTIQRNLNFVQIKIKLKWNKRNILKSLWNKKEKNIFMMIFLIFSNLLVSIYNANYIKQY